VFKKLFNRITQPVLPLTVPTAEDSVYTITIPSSAPQNYSYNMISGAAGGGGAPGNLAGIGVITAAQNPTSWITANTGIAGAGQFGGGGFTFNAPPTTHIVQFNNSGSEIVRLNLDGTVTWAGGIDIDAAADAFSKSLQLGAEIRASITKSVKLKMRDSVFEDLINIAKEKGSLTAEDLTYLLEASKIVEKLKGGS
jgi:hypothetical protein